MIFFYTAGTLNYYLFLDLPVSLRTCTVIVVKEGQKNSTEEKEKKGLPTKIIFNPQQNPGKQLGGFIPSLYTDA